MSNEYTQFPEDFTAEKVTKSMLPISDFDARLRRLRQGIVSRVMKWISENRGREKTQWAGDLYVQIRHYNINFGILEIIHHELTERGFKLMYGVIVYLSGGTRTSKRVPFDQLDPLSDIPSEMYIEIDSHSSDSDNHQDRVDVYGIRGLPPYPQ